MYQSWNITTCYSWVYRLIYIYTNLILPINFLEVQNLDTNQVESGNKHEIYPCPRPTMEESPESQKKTHQLSLLIEATSQEKTQWPEA